LLPSTTPVNCILWGYIKEQVIHTELLLWIKSVHRSEMQLLLWHSIYWRTHAVIHSLTFGHFTGYKWCSYSNCLSGSFKQSKFFLDIPCNEHFTYVCNVMHKLWSAYSLWYFNTGCFQSVLTLNSYTCKNTYII
jgi:hypothetical protein